jgi:hypothetical protein
MGKVTGFLEIDRQGIAKQYLACAPASDNRALLRIVL